MSSCCCCCCCWAPHSLSQLAQHYASISFFFSSISGGFIPWEFQSHAQIRGWLHPALFAALYQLLRFTGLDNVWTVAVAPRLLQGIFAGLGDFALFMLARRLFGMRAAKWTVSAAGNPSTSSCFFAVR